MSHTPGPWKFIEGAAMVRGKNDQAHVCDIRGFGCTDSECAENGLLIAAAPELLASIEKIEHFATGECDMPMDTRLRCIARTCQAVRAAMRSDTSTTKETE